MPDIFVSRRRAFELGTGACSGIHPVTLQPMRRFVIDMLASSPHGQPGAIFCLVMGFPHTEGSRVARLCPIALKY